MKRRIPRRPPGSLTRWLWLRLPGTDKERALRRWLDSADRRYNKQLLALIEATLEPDSNCVDIGAASGEILAEVVRRAPHGHHIAYEPLKAECVRLRERFPDVDIRQAAVSDQAGTSDFFHLVSDPGWSSLREYDTQAGGAAVSEHIAVRTVRLDDDLPADYVPRFIKVDVNGAEALVFAGMRETIRRHRPTIAFEHGQAARAYGKSASYVFELLTDEGGLDIFLTDGTGPLTRSEFAAAARREWNFLAR